MTDPTATDPRHLTVERVPLDAIETYPDNARRSDLPDLIESIRLHDFYTVVTAQCSTGYVLVGNHRYLAQRAADDHARHGHAGWERYDPEHFATIDVKWIDCDDDEAQRVNLHDNVLGEAGGYDDVVLRVGLEKLSATELGLVGTGYEAADLDALIQRIDLSAALALAPMNEPGDAEPGEPPAEPRTKRGDVWLLGAHRLLCGDCRTDGVSVVAAGAVINLAFTSPPYADRRTYDASSGFVPIPPDEYVEWFAPVAENVRQHLAVDGSWFVNIKPSVEPSGLDVELYVLDLVLAHARQWGWHFATEFCWERVGVPKRVSRRFKNQFEPVYQFTRGDWKIRPDAVRHLSDSVPSGKPDTSGENYPKLQGSGRSAILPRKVANGYSRLAEAQQGKGGTVGEFIGEGLAYPGNRLPTFTGTHEALGHAAAFPVGLPQFFVKAYTDPGDVVLDPFAGTGSTLLAAHNEGRIGLAIELSPAYCDIICERFQRHTGVTPVLESSGEPVDFAAAPVSSTP